MIPPRGIALVPLEGEPTVTLLDIPADCVRWTGDSRSLLYSTAQEGVSNIWEWPIAGGAAKQLTHFTSETILSFDLSKDGRQLVMGRDTSTPHVVLIRDVKSHDGKRHGKSTLRISSDGCEVTVAKVQT